MVRRRSFRSRKPRGRGYRTRRRKKRTFRIGGNFGKYKGAGLRKGQRAEKKFLDQEVDITTAITAGGAIKTDFLKIVEGVGRSQRVGRSVKMSAIHFIGTYYCAFDTDPTSVETKPACLTYVVLDKQSNGGSPAVTDFVETAEFNTFRNLEWTKRFQVLKKFKTVFHTTAIFDATATATDREPIQKCIKWSIPLGAKDLTFKGTTGVLGEITANNIFIYIVPIPTAASMITVDGKIRLRYWDN